MLAKFRGGPSLKMSELRSGPTPRSLMRWAKAVSAGVRLFARLVGFNIICCTHLRSLKLVCICAYAALTELSRYAVLYALAPQRPARQGRLTIKRAHSALEVIRNSRSQLHIQHGSVPAGTAAEHVIQRTAFRDQMGFVARPCRRMMAYRYTIIRFDPVYAPKSQVLDSSANTGLRDTAKILIDARPFGGKHRAPQLSIPCAVLMQRFECVRATRGRAARVFLAIPGVQDYTECSLELCESRRGQRAEAPHGVR